MTIELVFGFFIGTIMTIVIGNYISNAKGRHLQIVGALWFILMVFVAITLLVYGVGALSDILRG